jgi:3-hydroxybutyryl-CoA dehydrogenase
VIEAVVENIAVKKEIFVSLEKITGDHTFLASNTSSLSITSIAGFCKRPDRVMGIHFFNPATLMPLVEIIPAIQSDPHKIKQATAMINEWGKTTVLAKDTPGFIVNRVARPYYGEALRIYEEGIATIPEIDFVMTSVGGFRMGPFELMDLIGNDVNYAVTESVFQSFYFDPRYKPSLTQKKMVEAGWLGKKNGRGYYDYSPGSEKEKPSLNSESSSKILNRILVMLINEAYEALYLGIASREDIEIAMTKGVNYPKGLFEWSAEIGLDQCVRQLDELYKIYREDRYRCSPLLRKMSN